MSKVGPNIYKRKDGRWEARYVKSILPNGKKQYGSVYARTYQEVRKKQISFLQEPTIQQRFCQPNTFRELTAIWLDHHSISIKESSYQNIITL